MKFIFLKSYRTYGAPYADYLEKKGIDVIRFSIKDKPKNKFLSKKQVILFNLYAFIRILINLHLFRNVKTYCAGASLSMMLIYKLFGNILGRDAHLYIDNFYIHGLSENKCVKIILKFLLSNKKLTLIVQSPYEVEYYKSISNCYDICFLPYCSDIGIESRTDSLGKKYVFTGGYTNRDYPLMIKLAESMPEFEFVFVLSKFNNSFNKLPGNVTIKTDVDFNTFSKLLASAFLVVVPLEKNVGSSGQMLCLQSMRYSKPIVYTDISSINYYFTEDSGLPYNIGDLLSLKSAVEKVLFDEELARRLGKNAYENSLNYTIKSRLKMLDNLINIY